MPHAVSYVVLIASIALIGIVGFGLMRSLSAPPPKAGSLTRDVDRETLSKFVGDRACEGCHADQFRHHRQSNHALTLRPATGEELPENFPRDDHFADQSRRFSYALTSKGERYYFTVLQDDASRSRPVDYVFGSGKTGQTLVGMDGSDALIEFRMSYFPHVRRWEVTPGQSRQMVDPLGRRHESHIAQACFGCHCVAVDASKLPPENKFLGVGCEACHGPGREHVESVQRGGTLTRMRALGRIPARELNSLCGECHRTQKELDPFDPMQRDQTQRFQPYGLMKSACFQKSNESISCITCHDPHRNASRNNTDYEKVCLNCHGGGKGGGHTICPVKPDSGCIRCHMLQKEIPDMLGVSMADHWIRVFRQ